MRLPAISRRIKAVFNITRQEVCENTMESKCMMILDGYGSAGPVTDFLKLFWMIIGLNKYDWSLHLGASLGIWTVKRFTKPPFTTTILLDAKGEANHNYESEKIIINHDDGYEATAIAAVAGILQLLDGSIAEPGVIIMGHKVDPDHYIEILFD